MYIVKWSSFWHDCIVNCYQIDNLGILYVRIFLIACLRKKVYWFEECKKKKLFEWILSSALKFVLCSRQAPPTLPTAAPVKAIIVAPAEWHICGFILLPCFQVGLNPSKSVPACLHSMLPCVAWWSRESYLYLVFSWKVTFKEFVEKEKYWGSGGSRISTWGVQVQSGRCFFFLI